jgi:hypothetical protein
MMEGASEKAVPPVVEKRSLVLVAGIGRGPFEALAPVLDRHKPRDI